MDRWESSSVTISQTETWWKILKIRSEQVHIKLVSNTKNYCFYATEKSATRQKIHSFDFLLGILTASFYYFYTKFIGLRPTFPCLPLESSWSICPCIFEVVLLQVLGKHTPATSFLPRKTLRKFHKRGKIWVIEKEREEKGKHVPVIVSNIWQQILNEGGTEFSSNKVLHSLFLFCYLLN